MSRTIRTINPRTRQWLLKPDINHATGKTHEISKAWGRQRNRLLRGQDGVERHTACMTATVDSAGGFKLEAWCTASSKRNSDVSRKRRIAGKNSLNRSYNDYLDALEDEGKIFNWRGEDQDDVDAESWYEAMMDEYENILKNDRLQEEYEREMREIELDDWYDGHYYDDFQY